MIKTQLEKRCIECGNVRPLSRNGLCKQCAAEKTLEAIRQLQAKSGPVYEKWRASLLQSLEGSEP